MATVSLIPRDPTGHPRPIFKAMVQDTLDEQTAEANRAGAALLANVREVRQKARDEAVRPLKRKALYWFLILRGLCTPTLRFARSSGRRRHVISSAGNSAVGSTLPVS